MCPLNIAVVDAGGNLVAHVRMDDARIGAIDIAINKAWPARAFDMETSELSRYSQPGGPFFGIHASNGGRVMPGTHSLFQNRSSGPSQVRLENLWKSGRLLGR
jgi:uncharacterized protein GlcG (DUF336 family)